MYCVGHIATDYWPVNDSRFLLELINLLILVMAIMILNSGNSDNRAVSLSSVNLAS